MASGSYDHLLKPCECGAEYALPFGARLGPTVLTFTSKQCRVMCLACRTFGPWSTTEKGAAQGWNDGKVAGFNLIRDTRLALGLTQKRLAELAGLHPETVFRAESGEVSPAPETQRKLEAVLGIQL